MLPAYQRAQEVLATVASEYDRLYYGGILHERRARAQFASGGMRAGDAVYGWLTEAMALYEQAAELSPTDNDDAVLRWNSCARMIESHPELSPAHEDNFVPLLE